MTFGRVKAESSLAAPLDALAVQLAKTRAWQAWTGEPSHVDAYRRVYLVEPEMAPPREVETGLPETGAGAITFTEPITDWPDRGLVELYGLDGKLIEAVRYKDRGAIAINVEADGRAQNGTAEQEGEPGDMAWVKPPVRRPFAVVDDGANLTAELASIGPEDRYRQTGTLLLLIEADIPPEYHDSARDGKIWFMNQCGYVRDELLEDAARGLLHIRSVEKRMGPLWPDPAEVDTQGHFMQIVFDVNYGVG